jgi:integrase
MATTTASGRPGYGSGLYRRGNIFWVRVRTPARLVKDSRLRRFWRFSTGLTSSSEALRVARALRAALDRGFGLVGVWAMERELSRIEAEAVISRLARQALAEAELLRALPCARSEQDIVLAKTAHAQTGAAWRDALRRNDLAGLAPIVMAAAADAGVAAPEAAASPTLLREAARTLVAVAEENIAREDGIYAGDLVMLRDHVLATATRRTALDVASWAPVTTAAQSNGVATALTPAPVGATRSAATEAPLIMSDETSIDATASSPIESSAEEVDANAEPRAAVGTAQASGEEPKRTAPEAVRSPAVSPPSAAANEQGRRHAAAAPSPEPQTASAATAAPRRRRAKAMPKLTRRGAVYPHVEMLRRLEGDQLWDITISDAFALERHRASQGGNNKSWLQNSARGFDKSADLAASFFGSRTLREIKTVDCEDWRDLIIELPDTHGKAAVFSGALQDIVSTANEREDQLLSDLEQRAEAEGWSVGRLLDEEKETRIARLAPRTCYKHQSYLSQVFTNIVEIAGMGRNPMKKAMWTKAYKNELIAAAGATRVAWGASDRRRLFSTTLFVRGPATPEDILFWAPLLMYFMGGRSEEICQLKPEDVTVENGVPVFVIKAGPGQKLKSLHSARKIPIHPELIRLGILKLAAYRKSIGARTLFDVERAIDGTFSTRFSKIFHKWRHDNDVYMAGKDAHSLREDFYQSLKAGGVDYAARIVLMGHALNDVSETNYGHREWEIEQLKSFICTIPSETTHIRPPI